MKKIISIILILIILASIGIYFILKNKKNPFELILYGNIEIRQVDLSFQVAGQIEKMLKEEGDTVKKGELVATIDNNNFTIAPKIINNKNISCEYCPFKEICFVTANDYVYLEKKEGDSNA